jgi:integrase
MSDLPLYVSRDTDRYGKVRLYFQRVHRIDGKRVKSKKVRLPDDPSSVEFAEAYAAARRESEGPPPVPTGTVAAAIPGTLRDLIERYQRSTDWLSLDERTRYVRSLQIDAMLHEPIKPGSPYIMADCPIRSLKRSHIEMLRDRKASTPHESNNRIKGLRQALRWATKQPGLQLHTDPSEGVTRLATAAGGHHTWTVDEVEQYETRHPIGTKARLAMAILLYTGLRRSDAIRLGKQHRANIRSANTSVPGFRIRIHKGRKARAEPHDIPLLPELEAIIAASPCGDLTYLVTDYGMPFASGNGFGNKFKTWCEEAGLPHCSAHGLRKAAATIAADNGATAHQLMAIFGWTNLKQAETYTKEADRRRLATSGMGLIRRK